MQIFYHPLINSERFTLPANESKHCIKVLRMGKGDMIYLTDGMGSIFKAEITVPDVKNCELKILQKEKTGTGRNFKIHMAVAPTKNISRYEWFIEKVTEIGVDEITPLVCKHSERTDVKHDRLKKVLIAAMKQSLKTWLPKLNDPVDFRDFILTERKGDKFIPWLSQEPVPELRDVCKKGESATICIGPEGDFAVEEIELAKTNNWLPVRLGPSRLRTETAAVAACHMVNLLNW